HWHNVHAHSIGTTLNLRPFVSWTAPFPSGSPPRSVCCRMQLDRSRKPISLYDLVAERLRAYGPEAVERLRGRADKPDPEDRFTALVYERLNADDIALDVGCGDGNWLRLVAAPRAARTVGVDYGIARLEQARDAQRAKPLAG